jgi:hypothetical protein
MMMSSIDMALSFLGFGLSNHPRYGSAVRFSTSNTG